MRGRGKKVKGWEGEGKELQESRRQGKRRKRESGIDLIISPKENKNILQKRKCKPKIFKVKFKIT